MAGDQQLGTYKNFKYKVRKVVRKAFGHGFCREGKDKKIFTKFRDELRLKELYRFGSIVDYLPK